MGYKLQVKNANGTLSDVDLTDSVSIATPNQYGVVKPMATRNTVYGSYTTGGTTSGRFYGVELDGNGRMFVNVPWVSGSSSSSGLKEYVIYNGRFSNGKQVLVSYDDDSDSFYEKFNSFLAIMCSYNNEKYSVIIPTYFLKMGWSIKSMIYGTGKYVTVSATDEYDDDSGDFLDYYMYVSASSGVEIFSVIGYYE